MADATATNLERAARRRWPDRRARAAQLPRHRRVGVHADRQARPRRLPGRPGRRRRRARSALDASAARGRDRHAAGAGRRGARRAGRAPPGLGRRRRHPVRRAQRRAVDRRHLRLRPARRDGRGADRHHHRPRAGRHALHWRAARRARGGRPGRGLARVELGRATGLVNGVVELVVGQNARLRLVDLPGPQGDDVGLRGPARHGRPRRRRWTGSRSASARPTARSSRRPSSPAPAPTAA